MTYLQRLQGLGGKIRFRFVGTAARWHGRSAGNGMSGTSARLERLAQAGKVAQSERLHRLALTRSERWQAVSVGAVRGLRGCVEYKCRNLRVS